MNASICSADATTHLKIVATAVAVAIAVIWIGIATRPSPDTIAARTAVPDNSAASLLATIEDIRL